MQCSLSLPMAERAPSCLPVLLLLIYRPLVGIWQVSTVTGWVWGKEGAHVTRFWWFKLENPRMNLIFQRLQYSKNAQVEMHSVFTAMSGSGLLLVGVCRVVVTVLYLCEMVHLFWKGCCPQVWVSCFFCRHTVDFFLRLQADMECFSGREEGQKMALTRAIHFYLQQCARISTKHKDERTNTPPWCGEEREFSK